MRTVSAPLIVRDFSDSSLDLRGSSIAIDDRRFAAVEHSRLRDADVAYPGKVICPGLMDAHVHLAFDATHASVENMKTRSKPGNVDQMTRGAHDLVASGVVFARDLGSPGALAIEVRRRLELSCLPGPTLQVAGSPITRVRGHCWFMGGEVNDSQSAREAVAHQVELGADVIKVMITGGRMTPGTDPRAVEMPTEWLRAITHEAHSLGCLVSGHALSTAGVIAAAEGGVDVVEHGTLIGSDEFGIDSTRIDVEDRRRAIGLMSQKGVVLSPTFREVEVDSHPVPREIRAGWIAAMIEAGVRVVAGTDSGIPGASHSTALVAGLKGLLAVGLSQSDALAAASGAGMRSVGRESGGLIAPGQPAEFVVLEDDPRVNLNALNDPVAVMSDGVLYDFR